MSITINSQNLMSVSYRYGPRPYLTPVEHEVFDMQKRGRIEIEIAHALGISQTEVSCRLEAINRKIKSNESCGIPLHPLIVQPKLYRTVLNSGSPLHLQEVRIYHAE